MKEGPTAAKEADLVADKAAGVTDAATVKGGRPRGRMVLLRQDRTSIARHDVSINAAATLSNP